MQLPFERTHLHPGDRVTVAISGGADSVALLLTLHAANSSAHNALGIGLSALHVHHHLRGEEADGDQRFVEDLCARLDIELVTEGTDVRARMAEEGEGMEEAARAARYEIFARHIHARRADVVVTAHTLNDQAETVLLKLLRGAWTQGLSAIHPVVQVPAKLQGNGAGRVLRPFLYTRREEIESFLGGIKQPWREDSTNADTDFTRNRVRHELLPQLRTYNPAIDQTLANLAELAREEESRWQTELGRVLPQLLLPGKPVRGGGRAVSTVPGGGSVAIELDRLRVLDAAMRRRVLRGAARRLGARLSFDETARLLALCGLQVYPPVGSTAVSARTGSSVHLAKGLRAERSARELRLYLDQSL